MSAEKRARFTEQIRKLQVGLGVDSKSGRAALAVALTLALAPIPC